MSTQAMSHVVGVRRKGEWVIRPLRTPSAGARVVLMVLADFADEKGECYPAVETIAESADMSIDNARRHLRTLADANVIEIARNAAPDSRIPGNKRPNLYRITGVAPMPPLDDSGVIPDPDSDENRAVAGQTRAEDPAEPPTQARGGTDARSGPLGVASAPVRPGTGAAQTWHPREPNHQEPLKLKPNAGARANETEPARRDWLDPDATTALLDEARTARDNPDPQRPDPVEQLRAARTKTRRITDELDDLIETAR